MKPGKFKPPAGAVKSRKRLGCGVGSGCGKTSGKGHKGQKSRSGAKIRPWFEGGQMPLQRRLPKVGFNNPQKVVYQVVNLDDIARRGLSGPVTPEHLKQTGLIRSIRRPVKILGRGEVSDAIQVQAHAVSRSAIGKIEAAGGSVSLIDAGSGAG